MPSDRIAYSKPSTPLQRGRACGNCRRRKIRCDGAKPQCTPCRRNSRSTEECEYKDAGLSRVQTLEANIARLEAKIRDLQCLNGHVITLFQPYDESGANTRANSSRSSTPPSIISSGDELFEESLRAKTLLQSFLPYAHEFGFFMDTNKFFERASLPLPLGHIARPCPALLAAAYLWGVCLSQDETLLSQEHDYLSRALQSVAHGLSSDHPDKIMDGIQAEILLSIYFFRKGRFLEGKYHASAATTLAISSGLHRIRSLTDPNSLLQPFEDVLPPAANGEDEAVRIAGFWAVYTTSTCWSAVLRSPCCAFDSPALQIDTLWPLDPENFQDLPKDLVGHLTIRDFLEGSNNVSFGQFSISEVVAKASILYHRATQLVAQCHDNMPQDEFQKFTVTFTSLDNVIEHFVGQLPLPDHASVTSPSTIRALLVAHTLAHSASIQLHTVFSSTSDLSRNRCLLSARTVIDMIGIANIEQFTHFPWTSAAHILIDEIARLRRLRSIWKDESTTEAEQSLVAALNRGFLAMSFIALTSPLLDRQVKTLKESYATISPS
ncbi:hypothetical protein BDN72DRAFT_892480 [Pluteus cervinus]|uniref:Uncharacterized protein n=1 Tax=Pluteus cervinus TaxID=181527 RepID=A0ACD3BDQ6_9AGAR|nr:hypothetical protein BDN72DRAFT_892480 [Pluteus cervinus]